MATTTTTEVSAAVNNFYDRTMLKKAYPLLVHTRWAQVRDLPRNTSQTIKFRRYTVLTAATTALTEGTTPSSTALAITDVTAAPLQYGAFVELTDFLRYTTADPILTETADLLGQQAGNTLDQLCRDVIVAGTTINKLCLA